MIDRTKAAVLVIVLCCAVAACARGGEIVPLPEELEGRWQTDAAAYADRYLELSADTIVLGTGASTFETYGIDRVVRLVTEDGVLYTVHYRDEDAERYDIGFYFDPDDDDGATLRLRNQPEMAWHKVQ